MVQPVAVVFVHGINTSRFDYHEPMEVAIKASLPQRIRDHVAFRSVYWAGRVRKRQQQYLDEVARRRLFKHNGHRLMVVQGLGDAAAYQKTKSFKNSAYYEIQADVRSVLEDLDNEGHPDRPLIFIGHSLGCHIISSFAWDINSIKHLSAARLASDDEEVGKFAAYLRGGSPFRRLDTLAGLIMMGSNMPLFTFTFGPDRVFPISRSRDDTEQPAFPGQGLDAKTLSRARWLNYYSRNDLLGFPLKPLNEYYAAEERLSDIEVASEGWPRRLAGYVLPAPLFAESAHTGYWKNRKVVQGSAGLITAIATADEPPRQKLFERLHSAIKFRPSK